MITIQELLFNRRLDKSKNIRLMRHKSNRVDLNNLYATDKQMLFDFQRQQGKDFLKGVDYIVSFIGEEGTFARFIGVFKINGCKKLSNKKQSIDGSLYQYLYEISEINGFEDLKERVIIDWGKATIQWHQSIKNLKHVVEIKPGLHYRPFTDFLNIILDFRQLQEIIGNQYPDWKLMLSSTKGIYLIQDSKTGKLYVGAAYGDDGIWGRWANYVSTNGHGGNKDLMKLVKGNKDIAFRFKFSILMLLPKTVTADQAIEMEKLFKAKLGTKNFGYNNN
jgi:hypothetical protein